MTKRESLLIALALIVLFALPVVVPLATPLTVTPAWSSHYVAGAMVARGAAARLYALEEQALTWQVLGLAGKEALPFISPPYVALLAVPLSLLPYTASALTWALIDLVLAACILRRLNRLAGALAGVSAFSLDLAIIAFVPFTTAALALQNSFFLVLAVLMSRQAFKDGRDGEAGLWLSLFWLKPHLLVVPILLLAYKRRFGALLPLLATGAALGLVSLWMVGADGVRAYLDLLAARSGWVYNPDIRWPQMTASLAGLLQQVLVTPARDLGAAAQALWAAGSLAALAALLHAWRGPWLPMSFRFDLQWALLFLVTIFTTVHGYAYELVLLVPPFVVLYAGLREPPGRAPEPRSAAGRWLTPGSIRACLVLVPFCTVIAFLTGIPPLPLLLAVGAAVLVRAVGGTGHRSAT